ncbi:unnamed protein product, partial [Brugia pahangi]|uniref:EGF-like domain-containing protein n=1 Tax=Brugia pahangi TaxID=6280 RepID=A0A0N4TC02_BRUPA
MKHNSLQIVNECQSSNLNNCDKNAECIDTEEGYQCKCIPPYIDQNPSQPGTVCRKKGIPCGDTACQEELGEICSENQLCICPPGQKRSGPEKKCRPVESWSLPLLVIRQNTEELNYNDNLRNPQSDQYKEL